MEYLMKTALYTIKDPVIGPLITSGDLFFKSKMAAIGIPKFDTGPQKCVVKTYFKVSLVKTPSKLMNLETLFDIFLRYFCLQFLVHDSWKNDNISNLLQHIFFSLFLVSPDLLFEMKFAIHLRLKSFN